MIAMGAPNCAAVCNYVQGCAGVCSAFVCKHVQLCEEVYNIAHPMHRTALVQKCATCKGDASAIVCNSVKAIVMPSAEVCNCV